ncbi:hypothetical protein DPMN_083933 [Dreissena polymorpha]|uniref:Uncharacterized protein n=1 Tax=Dreissena polymorpha TaxID=45954 RepID=A0A9D3Y9W5_DREPO|nr:hypothetical protein DPMN_083933 [Dreissena polymorpha]
MTRRCRHFTPVGAVAFLHFATDVDVMSSAIPSLGIVVEGLIVCFDEPSSLPEWTSGTLSFSEQFSASIFLKAITPTLGEKLLKETSFPASPNSVSASQG